MTETLLTKDWVQRLSQFESIYVGFSGGMDSLALLYSISIDSMLKRRLRAIHINHQLSPNASSWEQFCHDFCKELNIPFIVRKPCFDKKANIEENARNARYLAFSEIMSSKDVLVLAHHKDDQAETVLLHLLRGAGINGLAAMRDEKPLLVGTLLRPLLKFTRHEIKLFSEANNLSWINDESNEDINFSRNYIRHQLMPTLQKKWPEAVTNISRAAEHCQQATKNLYELAEIDSTNSLYQNTLPIRPMQGLSRRRTANIIINWLNWHGVRIPAAYFIDKIIDEVLYAAQDKTPLIALENIVIRRYQDKLYLIVRSAPLVLKPQKWLDFPKTLCIGRLGYLQATQALEGMAIPKQANIEVSFRQGGEQFKWHGQTKCLKKLFQQWHIPPWQRSKIPLLYINNSLAAVIGWAISDDFYTKNSEAIEVLLIESPLPSLQN